MAVGRRCRQLPADVPGRAARCRRPRSAIGGALRSRTYPRARAPRRSWPPVIAVLVVGPASSVTGATCGVNGGLRGADAREEERGSRQELPLVPVESAEPHREPLGATASRPGDPRGTFGCDREDGVPPVRGVRVSPDEPGLDQRVDGARDGRRPDVLVSGERRHGLRPTVAQSGEDGVRAVTDVLRAALRPEPAAHMGQRCLKLVSEGRRTARRDGGWCRESSRHASKGRSITGTTSGADQASAAPARRDGLCPAWPRPPDAPSRAMDDITTMASGCAPRGRRTPWTRRGSWTCRSRLSGPR
ncbi:MAG: hypothetical protein JWP95_2031 [Actinotalea sp.]|nr:hypothetical protein [Actinotalea sp.]